MSQPCEHVQLIPALAIAPWPQDGCSECLTNGERNWVHLRVCQVCGHVGCCDSSPGKHAAAHAQLANHPLARSYEPNEDWWYCYIDGVAFNVDGAPPAPSYR
jgi:uncharacterized UBP type Zn finger protein